jgi:hypothetical protein
MSVKMTVAGALMGVVLTLGAAGPALAANPPSHDGHAAGVPELSLNQGRKWATDEALRQGMESIRETMAQSLGSMHTGAFSPAQYAALASALEEQVDGITRNCRLPPDADAQLHLVLAGILEGIDGLKSDDGRVPGAVRVLRALGAYGAHFDHQGWEPIGH